MIGIICQNSRTRLNLLKLFTEDCRYFFRTRCTHVYGNTTAELACMAAACSGIIAAGIIAAAAAAAAVLAD